MVTGSVGIFSTPGFAWPAAARLHLDPELAADMAERRGDLLAVLCRRLDVRAAHVGDRVMEWIPLGQRVRIDRHDLHELLVVPLGLLRGLLVVAERAVNGTAF